GFGGWVSTQALRGTRAMAGSSLDVRGLGQTKLGKAATGGVLGKAGGKGGYDASFKKSTERKTEFANYVGESTLKEKEQATKSKGLLSTYNAELAGAKKELEGAKLDESKKAIQDRISDTQKKIDAEQKIFDTADNAGKLRRETQANKLATSGSGLASYLKRKAGFKATTSDREAALKSRKKKDILGDLKAELKKEMGEEVESKEGSSQKPASEKKEQKGSEEIKERFTT
ncbi:MAG: hypothetical protein NUV42_02675, partial [Candidatus Yonathbacteria bacterium]|nr:hypothetical protein [Candidatus Yonathbacteria bacterium]